MQVVFAPLCEKIERKVAGWKSKLLSFGGKVTLIKHVISTVPIYTLLEVQVPTAVLKLIDQAMIQFLRLAREVNDCKHWIGWDNICKPLASSGLGIQPLWTIKKVAMYKATWQILAGDSLWASFCRNKYKNARWSSELSHPYFLKRSSFTSPL